MCQRLFRPVLIRCENVVSTSCSIFGHVSDTFWAYTAVVFNKFTSSTKSLASFWKRVEEVFRSLLTLFLGLFWKRFGDVFILSWIRFTCVQNKFYKQAVFLSEQFMTFWICIESRFEQVQKQFWNIGELELVTCPRRFRHALRSSWGDIENISLTQWIRLRNVHETL